MVGSRLNVNLNDPEDVRKKLPKVRAALEEKQREVEAWSTLVNTLEVISAEQNTAPAAKDTRPARRRSAPRRQRSSSPAQDAVVGVIAEHLRPMRAAEVAKILGRPRNPVSAAMWGAAKAGRLQQIGDGLYAAPGWHPPTRPNLLASSNGSDPGAAEVELPPGNQGDETGVSRE